MRTWKRLALTMLGVTALFNVILLTHMPDSSKAMPRAAESLSRKLGAGEGRANAAPVRRGLLRRWVLGSAPAAKPGSAGGREASPGAPDLAAAARGGGGGRSNAEKYLSHPHFSSSHRAASNGSAFMQQPGTGPESHAGALSSLYADAAEVVAAGISKQEASELEAVFGQMQETEAGRSKANLSSVAVSGSGQGGGPPDTPGGGSLQAAGHAQALMDPGEHPRAPVDPPDEASPGVAASPEELSTGMPMASPLPAPGSPSSAALQPPPPKGTGQGSEEAAGGLGGAEQPGLACEDEQEACLEWAAGDGCLTLGPSFMLESCRRSCGVCGAPTNASVPQTVVLNNGVVMPLVGFGTAGLGQATKEAVMLALASGYRLLDSAQATEWYREDLVGQALLQSSVPREEVFLTSKLHPRHHGYDSAMIQFTKSLGALAVEAVDLFLLHYPACWPGLCAAEAGGGEGGGSPPAPGTWQDSWRALESLVDKGLVRAIGVSNFGLDELAELVAMARIPPALVQRNSDPLSADAPVQAFCRLAGIQYQGYSTLGSQWLMHGHTENPVLAHADVREIAQETGRDPAQVVLRWALQHGQAVVPRSSKPERILANRQLDFALTEAQMQRIDALDQTLVPASAAAA